MKNIRKYKLIALILLDIIIIAGVWSFILSQKLPTPELYMVGFKYDPNYYPTVQCPDHLVDVKGTVFNAGMMKASNVTLVIKIIVTPFVELQNETIALGDIPEKVSIPFNRTMAYPSGKTYTFSTVLYELFWTSERSGFMMDILWLTAMFLTTCAILLVFNIYSMHKLGLFAWLKHRKKTVLVTLVWSGIVALILIKSYWLVYAENFLLFKYSVAWTEISGWIPRLNFWDLMLIFALSIIAGAILLDVETDVYSLLANYTLSFSLAVIYVVAFIWFSLGYNEVFAAGGFFEWGSFITYIATRIIFRMTFPLVQIFCLFGALVGTYTRCFLQPSAETFLHVQGPEISSENGANTRYEDQATWNQDAPTEIIEKLKTAKPYSAALTRPSGN
jgi:hypothetical protein